MAQQIQLRRGTASAWTSANPILAQGEMGVETDTLKVKLGDGTTRWNSLVYFTQGATGATGATGPTGPSGTNGTNGTSGVIGVDAGELTNTGTSTAAQLGLATTAVTAGSYTNTSLTVDSFGRLTAASSGTAPVTSVGLSLPSIFTVSNSPVTTTGTLTGTLATQNANLVFAGPTTGVATTPTFRSLVAADLPNTTVTAGSYTNTSLTVDAQGRLTAASSGTAPVTSVLGTASQISSTGGTTPTLSLTNTAVTAGSYTSTSLTVDAQGRITAASNGTAAPSPATVAPLVDGTAAVGTSLLYARQDHVHPTDTTRAPLASPTFTGTVTAPTGTNSAAPMSFVAGTNLSTATVGAVEFSTDGLFFTHNATPGRGLVQTRQIVRINTGRTKTTNNTSLEGVFDTANDTISLVAGQLYKFRGVYIMSTSATGSNAGITTGFTFSQTPVSIGYKYKSYTQASSTTQTTGYATVVTATTVTATGTTATPYVIEIEGWFKANATTGGTFVPAFAQSVAGSSVAPTASADTWFELQAMANTASNTLIAGAWS